MKYEIKPLKLDNGTEYLTIIFEDTKLTSLHSFIVDDFSAFTQDYLEIFDNVLSGKVEKDSLPAETLVRPRMIRKRRSLRFSTQRTKTNRQFVRSPPTNSGR